MKKTKKALVLLLLCAAALASCKKESKNNGDGNTSPLHGTWTIQSVTIQDHIRKRQQLLPGPGGTEYDWAFGTDRKATVAIPDFGGPFEDDSPFQKNFGSLDWGMASRVVWMGAYSEDLDSPVRSVTVDGRRIIVDAITSTEMLAICHFTFPMTDDAYETHRYLLRKR